MNADGTDIFEIMSKAETMSYLSDIAINVKSQYGAKGDGVTDDSTAIQNAVNNLPSIGGKLIFSDDTFLINSNINFNGKNIDIITGPNTTFTGTGTMPTNITNANHQIRRHYEVTTPSGGATQKGDATLTSEIYPNTNYIGNAVAGYFGAKTGTMSGSAWAINAIAKVDSGFTGFVNTIEIDTDCDSSTAQRVQGLLITGLGSQPIYAGLVIDRADSSRNQHGILLNNVIDGITVQAADNTGIIVQNTGLSGLLAELNNIGVEVSQAKQFGLYIHDQDANHIKLKPLTDSTPDSAVIFGVNAADTQVNWQVSKAGKGQFNGGVQINGGSVVKGILSSAPTLTFGSVPANSTIEVTTTLTGAKTTDSITANPVASPGNGLIWSAYVSAANTVAIRIANVTTGAITPASVQWIINDLQMF